MSQIYLRVDNDCDTRIIEDGSHDRMRSTLKKIAEGTVICIESTFAGTMEFSRQSEESSRDGLCIFDSEFEWVGEIKPCDMIQLINNNATKITKLT